MPGPTRQITSRKGSLWGGGIGATSRESPAGKAEKGLEWQPVYSQKAMLNLRLLHIGRDGWLQVRP
jgi:hypothetical protein